MPFSRSFQINLTKFVCVYTFVVLIFIPGGVDYGSVEDYPLVIPGGSGPGSVSCVHISITDDSILEYNETFTVSLSFESLVNVTFDPTEAKVTIKDDDSKHI